MANLIKIKRGFTAGAVPAGLTLGELAANLGDGKLYIGDQSGSSVVIGTGGGGVANVVLASASVTGVASFNIRDFVVSTTGHVGLTSQIVRSVNSTNPDANGNVVISGLPANIPLATSSITGVASFTNDFLVSSTGAVSLTGNVVRSVNGATGSVTIAQGTNVTISTVGNTITINSSGGGSSPPLATSSITGVASFNSSYFTVSGAGAVSLASGYQVTGDTVAAGSAIGISRSGNTVTVSNIGVTSFNGATGAITYAPPIATTSLTGVASFNSSYFTVNGSGAVSLASGYQVTGDTVVAGTAIGISRSGNTVTISNIGVTSFNGATGSIFYSPTIATSSITGVASFGNEFLVSAAGAVSLTANYVKSFNGATGAVTYSPRLATSSITGEASFTNDFIVSAAGAVSLTGNVVRSFNGATGVVSYSPQLATASLTGVASFNPIYFSTGTTGHINPTAALLTSGKINVAPTTLDDGSGTNASNFIMSRGLQTTKMDGIQTSTSGLTTTSQQVFTTRPFYSSVGSTAAVTIFGPGLTTESISYLMTNGVPTATSIQMYAPIGAAEVTLHLRRVSSGSLVGTELIRMSILSACDGTTNGTQYTESRIASGLQVATVAIVPAANDFKLTVTPVSGTDSTIIAANSTIYAGSLSIA